jgi:hypothetical protein
VKTILCILFLVFLLGNCTPTIVCTCPQNVSSCTQEQRLIVVLSRPDGCQNICESTTCETLSSSQKKEDNELASSVLNCSLENAPIVTCDNQTAGNVWRCKINPDIYECKNLTLASQAFGLIEDYKQVCVAQGGNYGCPGMCLGRTWTCNPPFSDAGTLCNASDQCQGFCEAKLEDSNCTANCTGFCTKYPTLGSIYTVEVINSSYVQSIAVTID